MQTNIKNLPEGKYFTQIGYSQQYPWLAVSMTASGKTVKLMKVNVKADPEWKPSILPGGFCGHCENQSEQTWLFDKIDENITRTLRLTKNGWMSKGERFIEDRAIEFYDYNF